MTNKPSAAGLDAAALEMALALVRQRDISTLEYACEVAIRAYLAALPTPKPVREKSLAEVKAEWEGVHVEGQDDGY